MQRKVVLGGKRNFLVGSLPWLPPSMAPNGRLISPQTQQKFVLLMLFHNPLLLDRRPRKAAPTAYRPLKDFRKWDANKERAPRRQANRRALQLAMKIM